MEDLEFKAIESGKRLRYYKQKYNLKNKDLVGDCKSGLATSEDKVSVWYSGGQVKNGKRSGQLSPKSIYAIIKRIIEIRPDYPKPRPEYLLCEDDFKDEIEYRDYCDYEKCLENICSDEKLINEIDHIPEEYIIKYMQLKGFRYNKEFGGYSEKGIIGKVTFSHSIETDKVISLDEWFDIKDKIKSYIEYIINSKIFAENFWYHPDYKPEIVEKRKKEGTWLE